MSPRSASPFRSRLMLLILLALTLAATGLSAKGKLGIYGIRMVPDGDDAENYSRPGWGIGIHGVLPMPRPFHLVAGTVGLDFINLLDETVEFRDRITQLRVEQQTNQYYARLVLGGQLGGHGRGFIRPYAGVNLAFILYGIDTDVVIPDDSDRENEIRQDLESRTEFAIGADITLGLDLNVSKRVVIDGGVRYLHTFSVTQQLGDDAETIHPRYFQIFLGVGLSFDLYRN